jgi:uncharacterized protein YbbK (DUF523 family)
MNQDTPEPAELPAVLVSACLLGVACNHRGAGSPHPGVLALGSSARLIPVCPEVAGGLPTPRPAAERSPDGRVRTAAGEDVTGFYERGAAQAVALARAAGAKRAVLKARSPSCASGQLYDGSHQRTLRTGDGVTTEALRAAGVEVTSEEDVEATDPPAGLRSAL